uniref:Uncharacterized protein n=1 Tax=Haptolina brevifila TaxID=156173 RepID=A0A7S2FX02_9EUKA
MGELGGERRASSSNAFEGPMRSNAFEEALRGAYELEVTVQLPNWPTCTDQLTVWRRRKGTEGEATLDPMGSPQKAAAIHPAIQDVRLEIVDLEAPRWAAPEPEGKPMMPSTSAFGAEGEKLFKM